MAGGKIWPLLVLDTSTVLKWFKEEEYTDRALEIKEEFVEGVHEIVVPDLILYEMSNAMRYSEAFNHDLTTKSLKSFTNLEVDIVTPTEDMMSTGVKLATENNITVYDAVFVSLARLIDATFITADEKLSEARISNARATYRRGSLRKPGFI